MLSSEPEALVTRVEALTAEVEPGGQAEQLAAALMDLYGEGLVRIFDAIAEDGSEALRAKLTEDGVVASLMLIHDLYPVSLEQRVQEALDSVRPYMESHGGNVELLGIEDGVAKLRLEGSCNGCAASASTLELAVEQALQATAPDLEGIDVEGVVAPPEPVGAFELPMVGGGAPVSGLAGARRHRCRAGQGGERQRARDRQRGGLPARLPQPLCGLRRRARPRRPRRRHARVPRVRARLRPAAGGPLG